MKSDLEKLQDGTIKLSIAIPHATVKTTWDQIVEEMVKNANVAGFRKGKAPKKIVEEKLDKEKVREEVLKKLLPASYVDAIKEHNIRPIINPKIHVEKLSDPDSEQNWQFIALTCEAPEISIGDYKASIQKITAKGKIIVPGKEPQKPAFEEIAQALLNSVQVAIPKILLEGEVERVLAQTLDEVKRLGLTLDQYLASTGRTPESLRAEYEKKAENDMRLEFALQKIAEAEKITVDETEINEAIQKAKDEAERKNLEGNRYLLASILRQQKTLDFIKNL